MDNSSSLLLIWIRTVIVTSGPSSVWPKKAYRNPTDQLVAFLDKKHGEHWAIFEFRAEGTGYPDSEVYNRIHHFPWPDHHPPPFAIIPNLMASMRNWLQVEVESGEEKGKHRVAVVHCKAGKGRSGTSACSYLISEEGWKREDALKRFTSRRMRSGFGNGVSIPSQLRWVGYVDRWTNHMNKQYVERPVEILELQVMGLRDGVKVCVEGFVDEGRQIKTFHTFTRDEKIFVDGVKDSEKPSTKYSQNHEEMLTSPIETSPLSSNSEINEATSNKSQDIILRPKKPIQLATSDMNVDFERRNKVKYTGYTMVTSIAHVWINAWFEGGYEGADSGVFEIDWAAMDGIKGSIRKGTQAFDHLKVVWRYIAGVDPVTIREPQKGERVREGQPADWSAGDSDEEAQAKHSDGVDSGRGASLLTMGAMINAGASSLGKELGLRKSDPESTNISRANSVRDSKTELTPQKSIEITNAENEDEGVRTYHPDHDTDGETEAIRKDGIGAKADTAVGRGYEAGMDKAAHAISKVKGSNSHDKA